ncbi:hypothetical protein AAW00_13015 [Aurantiacibacter luteus]|uniref:DUF465 domain-containing protein n=2 Tax=Aurantiacibacter luteus TaxID=1581420 RepID=A0A0G9MNR5_9SPHN|nr:hypothetical protein AAW00_13015 [Aurantiacibacter luteus]
MRVAAGSPDRPDHPANREGDEHMVTSHVSALHQKHEGLDRRLRDEMNRPSPDSAIIQLLKKQKLRIKEELAHI